MPKERKLDSQKQNFLQGALVLSLATAIVKIIGALFKIPIQNLLQEDGSAHFQVAYQIYSTLFVLSTAGLPVAISKLVSESETAGRRYESKMIFRSAFILFMFIGVAGSALLYFGAPFLAGMMNDEKAVTAIRAISPAVFFVSLVCPYRGYHQGKGNMIPTALSQVVEALGKLVFGLLITWMVASSDQPVELQAAGAIGGVAIGTALAALFLILTGREKANVTVASSVYPKSGSGFYGKLLKIAVPITISATVLSLTNLIDTSMVFGRLKDAAGFTESAAEHYYGAYTWSTTLFNLPPAFIVTLSVSVIPAIVSAITRRDRKQAAQTIESSLRMTALLSLPAAAGLTSLAWPILNLLYLGKTETVIKDGFSMPGGVDIAAPLLTTLGFGVIFVCLVSLTNAILQALGLVNIPVLTMLIGAAAKIACNFLLVGNPGININGAPIGTIVCYGLISILNLSIIIRVSGVGPRVLRVFARPLLASVLMGAIARGIYLLAERFIGARLAVIAAILLGVISYCILAILLKAIPKQDIMLIPNGKKIAKALRIK